MVLLHCRVFLYFANVRCTLSKLLTSKQEIRELSAQLRNNVGKFNGEDLLIQMYL